MKLKVFTKAVAALFLIAGIACLLFKPVSNHIYIKEQSERILAFEKEYNLTSDGTNQKCKRSASSKKATNASLQKLKSFVESYNKRLYSENQVNLGNSSLKGKSAVELNDYGIKDNIYGYIIIERLNLKMPILLGATFDNMALGAVHISETSLPYGGKNTNAVIAGHCGYGGNDYFRYIETLEKNDIIQILTPFKRLEYSVTYKKVIEPSDIESIKIQRGEDMITLFTCYPYPTSRYRICVFCDAVKH